MILKIKVDEGNGVEKEKGNHLINHQAAIVLSPSLPYTPLEKARGRKDRKAYLSVPSSRGTPTYDNEDCDTVQG